MQWCTSLIPAWGRQRQKDLCLTWQRSPGLQSEVKVTKDYIVRCCLFSSPSFLNVDHSNLGRKLVETWIKITRWCPHPRILYKVQIFGKYLLHFYFIFKNYKNFDNSTVKSKLKKYFAYFKCWGRNTKKPRYTGSHSAFPNNHHFPSTYAVWSVLRILISFSP